jgi:hypothetical protein
MIRKGPAARALFVLGIFAFCGVLVSSHSR